MLAGALRLLGSMRLPARPVPDAPRSSILRRQVDRVTGALVPSIVDSVDIDEVVERVDVNEVLDRVDVDRLLDRVDVDRLLDRVDVDRLLDRVDPDRLLDRVDPDRLLDRVDVDHIVARTDIGGIVSQSTGQAAEGALDLARRQVVGVDLILMRTIDRALRRDPSAVPGGPALLEPTAIEPTRAKRHQVTGHYAGAVTRLLARAIDGAVSLFSYGLLVGLVLFVVGWLLGIEVSAERTGGVVWSVGLVVWLVVLEWASVAAAGRTLGKWVVGLRVVGRRGEPITPRRAFGRALVLPFSVTVAGLGLIGVVIGREHRALHDLAGQSTVVYDWGDRPAELPAPLTRWIQQRSALVPAPVDDAGQRSSADR